MGLAFFWTDAASEICSPDTRMPRLSENWWGSLSI